MEGSQASAAGEGDAAEGRQSQEELRERIEEQLRRLRVQDVLLESAVSVLNLAARRIVKPDERDLEQARVGIEAVRALVALLDPEPAKQVRNALSEIQVLFARGSGEADGDAEAEAGARAAGETGAEGAEGAESPPPPPREPAPEPPRRPPPGLWTPPGT